MRVRPGEPATMAKVREYFKEIILEPADAEKLFQSLLAMKTLSDGKFLDAVVLKIEGESVGVFLGEHDRVRSLKYWVKR